MDYSQNSTNPASSPPTTYLPHKPWPVPSQLPPDDQAEDWGTAKIDALAAEASTLAKLETPGDRARSDRQEEHNGLPQGLQRSSPVPRGSPSLPDLGLGANPTTQSIFGGNKIRHIKRDDGVPLLRKDIQFDFIRAVFEDRTPVFTNVRDGSKGHIFADIYIDAMAESKKTSKVLKEKLFTDRAAAINMAMICLLVNVGRMNTTLNFFPEMRAALRTYHAIPCLQLYEDPSTSYKQLQDAPRLKSILKGSCEDNHDLFTLEAIKAKAVPRVNPVNLIFVLAQYAPKVTEAHFSRHLEFFDLITKSSLSSRSRASALLWLVWWYLESDFTADSAARNPFGPGQGPEVDGIPQKLPPFEYLSEEQAQAENVDTEEEIEFGHRKQEERKRINETESSTSRVVESEDGSFHTQKRPRKTAGPLTTGEEGGYHSPHDRSSPHSSIPSARGGARARPRKSILDAAQNELSEHRSMSPNQGEAVGQVSPAGQSTNPDGDGANRINSRRRNNQYTKEDKRPQRVILRHKPQFQLSNYGPNHRGTAHLLLQSDGTHQRPRRPLTTHQMAVERNRQARVEHTLASRMQGAYRSGRRIRYREGALWRAWRRQEHSPDRVLENSDDEENNPVPPSEPGQTKRAGELISALTGLPFRERGRFVGLLDLNDPEDFGEELETYAAGLRRTLRRLDRWDLLPKDEGGVMDITTKKPRSKTAEWDEMTADGMNVEDPFVNAPYVGPRGGTTRRRRPNQPTDRPRARRRPAAAVAATAAPVLSTGNGGGAGTPVKREDDTIRGSSPLEIGTPDHTGGKDGIDPDATDEEDLDEIDRDLLRDEMEIHGNEGEGEGMVHDDE